MDFHMTGLTVAMVKENDAFCWSSSIGVFDIVGAGYSRSNERFHWFQWSKVLYHCRILWATGCVLFQSWLTRRLEGIPGIMDCRVPQKNGCRINLSLRMNGQVARVIYWSSIQTIISINQPGAPMPPFIVILARKHHIELGAGGPFGTWRWDSQMFPFTAMWSGLVFDPHISLNVC